MGISNPYLYKIKINTGEIYPEVLFLKKKEAIKFIKNNWMAYYEDRTEVEFIEHQPVDMKKLIKPKKTEKSRFKLNFSPTQNIIDSCPSSPSPRSIRKNSFSSLFKASPRSSSSESSPRDKSPRWFKNDSPRSLLQMVSQRLSEKKNKSNEENDSSICIEN